MKLKRTALLFLAVAVLLTAAHTAAFALPDDNNVSSDVYTQQTEPYTPTQPPYIEPTEQETQAPTEPPYSEPDTVVDYTDPPVYPETDPVSSQEETQPEEEKSWLDIFKLPTQAIPTEGETIPEKTENTTTTQYVVMGILMWVVIALGVFVALGVLASTHRRKRGK